MGAKSAVAKDAKDNPFSGRFRTKKYQAAILAAEDELTDDAIAAKVGVGRTTFYEWKRDPEFAAIVGDYQGEIIAEALKLPIAKKHERIRQLNDLQESYWQIIRDRGERYRAEAKDSPDSALARAFGDHTPSEASTGMLVKQMKIAANGKTVTDWVFDRALDSAIKETHKQAAQELGQWEENLNVTHGGTLQQEYVIVEDVPWDSGSDGGE